MSIPQDSLIADPEIGILRELEADLLRELAALKAPARRERPLRVAPQRRLRRQSVRITRRALVLVVLVSLVGSSALAASVVLSGSAKPKAPSKAAPVTLAAGAAGGQRWQLETYLYDGARCYAIFDGATVASRCGSPPPANDVGAVSALSASSRLVAGLAGARVASVRVRVGGISRTVATRPAGAGESANGRLPAGLRWFAAVLPSDVNEDDAEPAQVTPLGGSGRQTAAPALDCSLGGASALCRSAAERIAAAGESPPG